jgi:hypothetical protein
MHYVRKNTLIVHLSLFNSELKLLTSIFPCRNSKFDGYFFLNFSKIALFHINVFVCTLTTISIIFSYVLVSSMK